MDTKGLHLDNEDTDYKQALLYRLIEAFCDESFAHTGELALEQDGRTQLECGLVFDRGWRADIDRRFFGQN